MLSQNFEQHLPRVISISWVYNAQKTCLINQGVEYKMLLQRISSRVAPFDIDILGTIVINSTAGQPGWRVGSEYSQDIRPYFSFLPTHATEKQWSMKPLGAEQKLV